MQTYGFLPMRLPEDFAFTKLIHAADERIPVGRARVRRRGGLARDPEVPLRLLLLGGTKFLGRAVAEAALATGHELTLFNRGETNPELFPEAEKLRGDRDGDLAALEGREWDAVVDPSGFVPRVVGASADLLADAVGHYVFVSSISVYGAARPARARRVRAGDRARRPGERGRAGGLRRPEGALRAGGRGAVPGPGDARPRRV